MQKKILNYRIIIEPEAYPDGSTVYVAYCPTLGISDYGDTIEEVMRSIQDGMTLAIESLTKKRVEVPIDDVDEQIITTAKVTVPEDAIFSFAS